MSEHTDEPGSYRRGRSHTVRLAVAASGLTVGTLIVASGFPLGDDTRDSAPRSLAADDNEAEPTSADDLPGGTAITLLGDPVSHDVTEAVVIPLAPPEDATHVRISVIATSAGSLFWGTDPGGNNPSGHWTGADVADGPSEPTFYDFPLDPGMDSVRLDPSGGYAGTVTVQFARHETQPYQVNANGQTYGALPEDDRAGPDLIAVAYAGEEGSGVPGYVYATDFDAMSPDHPGQPSNPEEANRWQEERAAKYPDGWDIPVYESDGVTQIGLLHWG